MRPAFRCVNPSAHRFQFGEEERLRRARVLEQAVLRSSHPLTETVVAEEQVVNCLGAISHLLRPEFGSEPAAGLTRAAGVLVVAR